jgi:hypothetical protein
MYWHKPYEGKRIVLPAFFQRGRDSPDKTRQTFATAHTSVDLTDARSQSCKLTANPVSEFPTGIGPEGPSSSSASCLLHEPFGPVRQLPAPFRLVRQLRGGQRERLGVPGDSEGPGVHRIEPHVADQASGHTFANLVVADPRRSAASKVLDTTLVHRAGLRC